ncbi:unnamed protein product [Rotaria sp. Silwood1]|nr:unnamed protein product [Rotaria sp. Silwood1]
MDILWGFTRLNHHLATLIIEKGFFRHINLSFVRYHQFNTILRFLPLNDIQSVSIDSYACPLQLTLWPYMPRLRTLRIIGDGHSIDFTHPLGDLEKLMHNILLIHFPALRSLDFGLNCYWMNWPITVHVPLTYLRLLLPSMDDLVRIMSTQKLSYSLCQLHVRIGNGDYRKYCTTSIFHSLIPMVNLHTFTFFQHFFSWLRIEWTFIEMLTSSNVMPVLRRVNISYFINIDDLKRIGSSSIFTDHRHIDVHFAFHLINCSEFLEMTQYIPRGNCFYPREIVGATFVVNDWSYRPDRIANDNHFGRGFQYRHHMWYTLPWTFDEFFHEYELEGWITKIQVFEQPQTMTTIYQSFLRTLDTSSENMTSSICSLPHVVLSDCIETCNLFYYNTPFAIHLSALRNITLVNSINCLNDCSSFAATIRSIRIYIMYRASNYMLPDWPAVLYSLSTLQQLNSLGIFMYDLTKPVDTNNCQMIAEEAVRVTNFVLCFRRACCSTSADEVKIAFKDNTKFIKQLCHSILRLSLNKHPYYSIEDDGCGLITWF